MHKSPAKKERDKLRMSDLCLDCEAELTKPFILKAAFCDDCKERHTISKDMWRQAHTDKIKKETIALGIAQYNIHPQLNVDVGDVLIAGCSYIHPALMTPIPRILNTRSRRYWDDLIETLPKRRRDIVHELQTSS